MHKPVADFQFVNPKSEIRNPKSLAGLGGVLARLLSLMLCMPAIVMACPMCKEAFIEPEGLGPRLAAAKGYAASILLLLAVPVGLIGGIAAVLARAQRLSRKTSDI